MFGGLKNARFPKPPQLLDGDAAPATEWAPRKSEGALARCSGLRCSCSAELLTRPQPWAQHLLSAPGSAPARSPAVLGAAPARNPGRSISPQPRAPLASGSPVPGSWLLVRGRGNGISQGCRENTGGSSMGSKRSSRLTDDVGLARALLRSGIWGGCVGPTGKMYKLSFPKCGCQEKRWPLPRVAFLPFLSRWSRDAGSSVVNFMGWRIYRDRGKSRGGRR